MARLALSSREDPMKLRNGFPIAASDASVLALMAGCCSCTGSYTTQLELWPPTPDASSSSTIAALAGYDAALVEEEPSSPMTPVARVDDAGAAVAAVEAGPASQPHAAMDASIGAGGYKVPEAGADSATHQAPDAGPPKPHALTVVVTTIDDGQGYSPANVGAIWIAQSSGAFVKTLQEWGKTRIDHLILWNSATKAAGVSRNTVDAITGSTGYSFGTHVVYWNFTDTSEKIVPDGAYRVYFETADYNVAGPNTFVDFTKGPTAATFTFPDTPSFTDLKLVLSP